MFETFRHEAREAIMRAQREACEMGHGAVGVEHLLLGLFSPENEMVGRLLADFGLTIRPVRDMVRERIGVGPGAPAEGQLPFSPSAEDALRSAHRFGMGEAGTEHMLIVLVRGGQGGAGELLTALRVDPNRIRFETRKRAWPSDFGGAGTSAGHGRQDP